MVYSILIMARKETFKRIYRKGNLICLGEYIFELNAFNQNAFDFLQNACNVLIKFSLGNLLNVLML